MIIFYYYYFFLILILELRLKWKFFNFLYMRSQSLLFCAFWKVNCLLSKIMMGTLNRLRLKMLFWAKVILYVCTHLRETFLIDMALSIVRSSHDSWLLIRKKTHVKISWLIQLTFVKSKCVCKRKYNL